MLGLSDLKETKVYQEAVQEGEQRGALKESQSLVLRQLSRRIGEIPVEVRSQIQALSLEQTEALGEALLDFADRSDLEAWLEENQ